MSSSDLVVKFKSVILHQVEETSSSPNFSGSQPKTAERLIDKRILRRQRFMHEAPAQARAHGSLTQHNDTMGSGGSKVTAQDRHDSTQTLSPLPHC
jgi:hypothetical protein